MPCLCFRLILLSLLTLLCSACGSGPASTSGAQSGTANLQLTMSNSKGAATTSLGIGETTTITATLTDLSGNPVPQMIVNFTNNTATATLFPASGTALTDSNGNASIQLTGVTAGADSLKASATIRGSSSTSTILNQTLNYSVTSAASASPTLQLSMTLPNGSSATTLALQQTATITATVLSAAGTALPGLVVSFSNNATIASQNPSTGKSLTDANGQAQVQLTGLEVSADTLTASVTVGSATLQQSLSYSVSTPAFALGALVLGANPISAGGTTSISVSITDPSNNNTIYPNPVKVSFSSPCATAGKATLDSTVTSVISSTSNTATATYKDNGCASQDTVTATLAIGDRSAQQTATLTVQAATAAAIQFVSATPSNISLKGIGGVEQSVVIFKVTDALGDPVANTQIDFSLNTIAGGVSLDTSNALTQSDGTAQVVVNSGHVSCVVRVTAHLDSNTSIQSQSNQLTISTGVPHQNGFSLALQYHNPEFYAIDGANITASVRATDRFGNAVPDGTAISFWTEGGIGNITSNCQTVGGSCGATLTSSGNRAFLIPDLYGRKGRQTLMAFAVGEESFTDVDGSGLFDNNSLLSVNGISTDMPEAFLDADERDMSQPTQLGSDRQPYDPFVDFNNNGLFDLADGKFNGKGCVDTTGRCGAQDSINVRSSQVVVWSSHNICMTIKDSSGDIYHTCNGLPVPTFATTYFGAQTSSFTALQLGSPVVTATSSCTGKPINYTVWIYDENGNAPPYGATLTIGTTNGKIISTSIGTSPIPDTTEPLSYSLNMASDGGETNCSSPTTGTLTIAITTLAGNNSSVSIPVQDSD